VRPGGLLQPTPRYDLVSVLQYDGVDTELAMAYGDVFSHAEVSAFALADVAARCGVDRKLMRRAARTRTHDRLGGRSRTWPLPLSLP